VRDYEMTWRQLQSWSAVAWWRARVNVAKRNRAGLFGLLGVETCDVSVPVKRVGEWRRVRPVAMLRNDVLARRFVDLLSSKFCM
jgi:hypothetical protein